MSDKFGNMQEVIDQSIQPYMSAMKNILDSSGTNILAYDELGIVRPGYAPYTFQGHEFKLADGSEFEPEMYPDLLQKINNGHLPIHTDDSAFGYFRYIVANDLSKLKMPDWRGYFMRYESPLVKVVTGEGENAVVTYTRVSNEVGVPQGDAIRHISGGFSGGMGYNGGWGAFYRAGEEHHRIGRTNGGTYAFSYYNFDSARQSPVSTENRPINISMQPLIYMGSKL